MKTIAALVISFVIIMPFIASCIGNNTEVGGNEESKAEFSDILNSAEETQESDSKSTDEHSDTPSTEPSVEPSIEPLPDICEIYKTSTDRYASVISYGKKYTTSVKAAEQYADDGYSLTDSITASENLMYTNYIYCGFLTKNLDITLDLGNDGSNVYGFVMSFLSRTDAGLAPPSKVTVSVSDDSKQWESKGDCTIEPHEEATNKKAFLYLADSISCRYVRFTVQGRSSWLFFDEVYVIADVPFEQTVSGRVVMEGYKSSTITESYRKTELSYISNGNVPDFSVKNLVSFMKDVKMSSDGRDDRIESTPSVLTDGKDVGSLYSDSGLWYGVKADSEVSITIDLGKKQRNIYSFSLYCISNIPDNVILPAFADVYAGDSENALHFAGRAYAPLFTAERANYKVSLSQCIDAKYVRFVLPASAGKYYRFEEASVISDRYDTEVGYYGDFSIDDSGEPFPDKTLPDYNTVQNLALGKRVMMKAGNNTSPAAEYNPTNIQILTDGKRSQSYECYNGYWLRTYGAVSRTVVIDLEHISAVKSISTDFISRLSWGVGVPEKIVFSLSENGKDWYTVKSCNDYYNNKTEKTVTVTAELDKQYKARYAKLYYTMDYQVFIDEITVMGCKNVSASSSLNGSDFKFELESEDIEKGYLAPFEGILGGVKDVMLAYHNSSYDLTEEHFLPYVAYLDKDGNIKDTMFDGFLFLPITSELPSGAKPDGGKTIKSDWESVFNSIFSQGKNMDALDKTVEKVKTALGITDYKVKVYVSLINLHPDVTSFGDVDGDGKSENLSLLSDCRKVVDWYMAKVEKAMSGERYKNVELCGYYWFSEQCGKEYEPIVKAAADTVHKNGQQFFWIPWFTASGYNSGDSFGFDAVCMQPNYAFNINIPESRLAENARLTALYGLCYEMETSDDIFYHPVFLQKYMNYMKQGVILGYADAINMYYQSMAVFGKACYSKKADVRLIYDYQYRYMKNTLQIVPDTPQDLKFKAESDKPFTSSLAVESSEIRSYVVISSPLHGSLALNGDGSFTYYPDSGYKGDDCFVYAVNDRLCDSEKAVVHITVQ